MIAFIGLGAAGGNIADEAVKQGFPGVAINYSQRDLDSLEFVKDRLRLVGSEGVGKNRTEAIRLMENNWESAVTFVKERYSSPAIEVIIVSFSTGGGSGSGMAPILLEIMMNEMPDKTFVAAPILPSLSEVMINQMNCIQASEELSKLNICVLPIDNEKSLGTGPYVGKNTIYKRTNKRFVEIIKEVMDYTDKTSKNGVLDKRDLRTILNTKGVTIIGKAHLSIMSNAKIIEVSEKGIAEIIRFSWENSIFAPIQYNKIIRAGIVFDGQDSLMELIDFKQIFGVFKNEMPIDLFEGYYNDKHGTLYSILAGLSWYNNRLEKIEKMIEDKQEVTEELMDENETYQSKVNHFSTKMRNTETKKKSVSDILSRYRK